MKTRRNVETLRKHLTKAEIEERKSQQVVAPVPKDVEIPEFLPEELKERFLNLANQLIEIGIFSNVDAETLARYVIAQKNYEEVSKELEKEPVGTEKYFKLINAQDKLFKQCQSGASKLGLSITDRTKIVVQKPKEEKPKNKFAEFLE
jgi:P27 family predicted phage terminase small subunit